MTFNDWLGRAIVVGVVVGWLALLLAMPLLAILLIVIYFAWDHHSSKY